MGSRVMQTPWLQTGAIALRFASSGSLRTRPIARNTCIKSASNWFSTTALVASMRHLPSPAGPVPQADKLSSEETFISRGQVPLASRCARRWISGVERPSTDVVRDSRAWRWVGAAGAAGPVTLPIWSSGRRSLSSSSDEPYKKPEGPAGEAENDAEHAVEAEVVEPIETTPEEPRHSHVEMPSITDAERVGTVTSWHVAVGDAIQAGDVVCEIELEHFSVGVKVEVSGFLAEILVKAGSEKVPVGAPLATIVHSEEDIAFFQHAQEARDKDLESSRPEEAFSWKDVLKTVLRLRQDEKFSEDKASTLMSLARKKDAELLQAFAACFEGDDYKGEIDDDLFLVQALDIAKTRRNDATDVANSSDKTKPE